MYTSFVFSFINLILLLHFFIYNSNVLYYLFHTSFFKLYFIIPCNLLKIIFRFILHFLNIRYIPTIYELQIFYSTIKISLISLIPTAYLH